MILLVFKQPGANVIQTVEDVKAAMPRLASLIPPGMKIDTIIDRTQTIRASVADVEFTLALTIGLVVLVILLFLRNLRATLIPAVVVPLSLAGAAAVMYLLGFSLDNLSLMAMTIAVGFVVDDAIVVVENIYRHIEDGARPFQAALDGAREIGFTVVSISVSLVAVFIPLLLMGGIVGRLFREFALTVTAAIAVSVLVSLTLTPMLASRFLGHEGEHHGRIYLAIERAVRRAGAGYRRGLDLVLRHRFVTLMSFFATIALTGVLFVADPEGLLPDAGQRAGDGHHGGRAGRLADRDEAAAAQGRRALVEGSGHRGVRLVLRLRQRQHAQHRALLHRAEAARGAQRDRHADHRAAAPADRQARRREPVPAARAGHHGRRTHRRAASISTRCRTRT